MLHKKVVEVRHEMSEDASFKGFWGRSGDDGDEEGSGDGIIPTGFIPTVTFPVSHIFSSSLSTRWAVFPHK
jgi:hypothetical protein